jgi:uncharacterized Zn finger protein
MLTCKICGSLKEYVRIGEVTGNKYFRSSMHLFACRDCGAVLVDPATFSPRKEATLPRSYQEINRGK